MLDLTEFKQNLIKPEIMLSDVDLLTASQEVLTIQLRELEGLLEERFNTPLQASQREKLIELLRLFPNKYSDIREHCIYINDLNKIDSIYLLFIQKLRRKPPKRRRKRARSRDITPPKQKSVYHFKPSELKTDAQTFQYKENGDSKGVTDRLLGVCEWNELLSGIVIVWESKEGDWYIADGHQRLGLANRIGDSSIRLDGLLFKEVDGYTPSDVRLIAAKKNIAEGTGTPLDTAKIIRELGGAKNYPKDLPRSGVFYQYGIALSRLGEKAFQKIINGVISIEQGAVVANIIRDDHIKQSAAIDTIAKEKLETLLECELLARQVLLTPNRVIEQRTLFGLDTLIESYAVPKIKLINSALKKLRGTKKLMTSLVDNSKMIEDNGNILNSENNKGLQISADTSIEIIKKQAFVSSVISDKANELAVGIDTELITHSQGVDIFCDFCMQEDILKIIFTY